MFDPVRKRACSGGSARFVLLGLAAIGLGAVLWAFLPARETGRRLRFTTSTGEPLDALQLYLRTGISDGSTGEFRQVGLDDGGLFWVNYPIDVPLRGMVLGAWTPDGHAASGAAVVFEVPAGAGLTEVRLAEEAPISGTILDVTGQPAEAVSVYVGVEDPWGVERPVIGQMSCRDDWPWLHAVSGRDGRFAIAGTAAGHSYTLWIDAATAFGRVGAQDVRRGNFVAGTSDARIELGGLRPIGVEVVRQDGSPIAGVQIAAWQRERTSANAYTDASGRVLLQGLDINATYRLTASTTLDRRPQVLGGVRVDWSPRPERFVLVETVVVLVDETGSPVSHATLWVLVPPALWQHGGYPLEANEAGEVTLLTELGGEASLVALRPPPPLPFPRPLGGETRTALPTQRDGRIQIAVQQPTALR